jgi:hypothetical protein
MAYTKFTLKVTFNINITSMSKNKLTWKLPPGRGARGEDIIQQLQGSLSISLHSKSLPPLAPLPGGSLHAYALWLIRNLL